MEIKRIKEIKNIGTFSNFSWWWPYVFEKLTFIYWLNTFWKTTLTDVFQSLKYNTPDLLIRRKTIPYQGWDQVITLSIKENSSETDLKYATSNWWANTVKENLEVFGSEFIHKNLFTWYTIERPNKENFTEFILWEEWVRIAQEIKEDKQIYWVRNKSLKDKLPKYLLWKEKGEYQKFLGIDINWLNEEQIKTELLELQTSKKEEENRLAQPQKILWIGNVSQVNIPKYQITKDIEELNTLFQKDYGDMKEELLDTLKNHIDSNFSNQDWAQKWIKQWYDNITDSSWQCLFCSQSLENAKDMMDLYDKYFDKNYSDFIQSVEENLEKKVITINHTSFWLLTLCQNQLTYWLKYKEIILDPDFQKLLTELEELISKIDENDLVESKKILIEDIKTSISEKNKKPYKKIDEIDFLSFEKKLKKYLEQISLVNIILEKIQVYVTALKEKYKDTSKITESIKKIWIEIEQKACISARIAQDEDCKKFLTEIEELRELKQKYTKAEDDLKASQNTYLISYFDKINELFQKFWSSNFTLEKIENNHWHKPVYSLLVKFHGSEIWNDWMQTVFSESDRRALALAVFFAKIELKEQSERENRIIILDDPITSFDNERTKIFIDYLWEIYDWISQLIILTHYSKFLSDYYIFTETKPTVYKITKQWELGYFDYDYFLKSDYCKLYDEILAFINWWEKIYPSRLRNFIEKQYTPTMKEILVWLDVIEECRSKCCTYNHNDFTDDCDIENFRNFARWIFAKLYPSDSKQLSD